MDYDARISKIEVQLEMNQKEIERLHAAIDELRKQMLEKFDKAAKETQELREHTDRKIQELREHTDQKFQELREHTDQKIRELRDYTDQRIQLVSDRSDRQFAELRREMNINMRWMMGMWFATLGSIAGLAGRVFGLY